ncbi:MAG TPA: sialidase family protein, partial [Vicinamibacterales bacterium]|nr:sialidase family protein [Vicinamibacterales bacterium]
AANPSIAADGSVVAVAFSASDPLDRTDIYVAMSTDGGHTFGSPVRVNDVAGDASVNGEQPPRVEISNNAIVVVWTSKGKVGTRMLHARSDDGGKTFSHAAPIAGTDAAGNRGWESIAGPFALWLDHREYSHHDANPDHSKLYFGAIDGSTPPRALTGGVCYCCKTALATSGAHVYAAWRHVYPGNMRDIAFTASSDGGKTFSPPIRVSQDKWMINGCPENGPALAVDASHHVHVVWPTLVKGAEDNLALFYAQTKDATTFTPRVQIPTHGTPRHVQIAASDHSLVVAWDETADGRRQIVASHVPKFDRLVLGDGVYPAVASSGKTIVAAWKAQDAIQITIVE